MYWYFRPIQEYTGVRESRAAGGYSEKVWRQKEAFSTLVEPGILEFTGLCVHLLK